jgi:uncharacterized protein YdaU (DUF1376 family)
MKRPWMPFYVGDYLANTGHLSTEEHGVYLLLILHYWVTEGLPTEACDLAMVARLPLERWNLIERKIKPFFNPDWSHDRLNQEVDKSKKIIGQRSKAGRIRQSNIVHFDKHKEST